LVTSAGARDGLITMLFSLMVIPWTAKASLPPKAVVIISNSSFVSTLLGSSVIGIVAG